MLYQEYYCHFCGMCGGLETGCSLGDCLDYSPEYNLSWVPKYEKDQLKTFIERYSPRRISRIFYNFVEPETMPPRVLEYYIWIADGRMSEAEAVVEKCTMEWGNCSASGCLYNYILHTLKEKEIPYMVEEIDYGCVGDRFGSTRNRFSYTHKVA